MRGQCHAIFDLNYRLSRKVRKQVDRLLFGLMREGLMDGIPSTYCFLIFLRVSPCIPQSCSPFDSIMKYLCLKMSLSLSRRETLAICDLKRFGFIASHSSVSHTVVTIIDAVV